MMSNEELILVYLFITDQLKDLVRVDFNLDEHTRFAISRFLDWQHAPSLSYYQLGRAVRHGTYKRRILHVWGVYFNSVNNHFVHYSKDVQSIMHDMTGAIPRKTFTLPDISRWPLQKGRALFMLARQGKIDIRAYLPGKSKGGLRLIVEPQVPIQEFDTPKGTWTYKGLTVSMKQPYVFYKGQDLKFHQDTDLFTILKLCVQRAEELVPFTTLHNECGKKKTASKKRRNQNIKNRIHIINKTLKKYPGCPLIHKDGENAVMR